MGKTLATSELPIRTSDHEQEPTNDPDEGASALSLQVHSPPRSLAFIRVDDYRAPQWPDTEHPRQFHLDFEVDEIESEQHRVLDLGATLRQDFIGPNGYGWPIYTDPIGHPFCLCRNKGVTWTDQGPVWPERG